MRHKKKYLHSSLTVKTVGLASSLTGKTVGLASSLTRKTAGLASSLTGKTAGLALLEIISGRSLLLIVACGLFLIFSTDKTLLAQPVILAEITVESKGHRYLNQPVMTSLQGVDLRLHERTFKLVEITGGKEQPVEMQLLPGQPDYLCWVLKEYTPPHTHRKFLLKAMDRSVGTDSGLQTEDPGYGEPRHSATLKDDGQNLDVELNGSPVLRYRHAIMPAPDGVDSIYNRSGFIHPLWSPEGMVLSRIQPPDHYHHYGLWNPWTRTEYEGRPIDFWNLRKGEGTVRSRGVFERQTGNVFARFKALHDHVVLSLAEGDKTVLHEQWVVTVWNADPENRKWVVDFASLLSPSGDKPLNILAYRYQGFSLRATETWNDNNARILTSQGYDKSNANATRARWLDLNGESLTDSGTSGILFLSHPGNFNHPEQLRIWPVGANRGTENVYINFNPAQEHNLELAPGTTQALKYRMILYDGIMEVNEAETLWNGFAHPPEVRMKIHGF